MNRIGRFYHAMLGGFRSLVLGFVLALMLALPAMASPSLSPRAYQALNDIQQAMSESQYAQAEASLQALEQASTGFALALSYQLHGQLILAQSSTSQSNNAEADNAHTVNTQEALVYFEKALALEAFKPEQACSVATNMAQLKLSMRQPQQAIALLAPRIETAEQARSSSVASMAYITLAAAHQGLQQYQASIAWLNEGIARAPSARENWLQMLMQAYYQTAQYTQAIEVLKRLIVMNETKQDYWLQQASLHQLLVQPQRALEVLELAYLKGVLKQEAGLILMTQLLINQGIPERGGRILDDLLSNDKITISDKHWQLLAQAWLQGRDRKAAIEALLKSAELASKASVLDSNDDSIDEAKQPEVLAAPGRLYYRAAQLLFEREQYRRAITVYQQAIEAGLSARQQASSLLHQGNAYFELGLYPEAKRYFSRAQKKPSTTHSATSWLNYMLQLGVLK